jgi:hypothetical protein
MSIDIISNKKTRRNPKTSRPLKKLLSSPPPPSSEKTSVHNHRLLFLKALNQHYKLPPFKWDLWSGTSLHLLFLTDKITPDMYQAAMTYTSLSRKNLFSAPTLSQISLDENLAIFERKKTLFQTPVPQEKAGDYEAEKIWRDLNEILIETESKILLDSLAENKSPDSVKTVLKNQALLKKLQKGLNSLQKYLEETSL